MSDGAGVSGGGETCALDKVEIRCRRSALCSAGSELVSQPFVLLAFEYEGRIPFCQGEETISDQYIVSVPSQSFLRRSEFEWPRFTN